MWSFSDEANWCRFFCIICSYLYCRLRYTYQEGENKDPIKRFNLLHVCVYPKPGPIYPTSYVVVLFYSFIIHFFMIWGERWLLVLLILVEWLTCIFLFVNHLWFIIKSYRWLCIKQKTTNIHFKVSKCKSPAIDIHLTIISNCFTFIWSQASLIVRFLSSWICCHRKIVGLRMRNISQYCNKPDTLEFIINMHIPFYRTTQIESTYINLTINKKGFFNYVVGYYENWEIFTIEMLRQKVELQYNLHTWLKLYYLMVCVPLNPTSHLVMYTFWHASFWKRNDAK